jgi:protein SOK2
MQGSQPLSIDTGLSNARSVPTTPASTPPGNTIQGTPQYAAPQSYQASRPVYSAPAGNQAQYPSQIRFGGPLQSATYPKAEMAPSARTGKLGTIPKLSMTDRLMLPTEDEAEHEHDSEYTHTSAPYNASRNSYTYNPNPGAAPISGEVAQVAEDISASPHQNGSGRATPRTTTTSQSQWQHGYTTPQRNPAPGSNVYSVIEPRGANGATDTYYHHSTGLSNGSIPPVKRSREDDDEDDDGSKRLKTESEGGPVGGSPFSLNRNRAAISQRRR